MDPSRGALQACVGAALSHSSQTCCSGAMFFCISFITLPARTLTFATILGKLSFQKCFTSLFWSNSPSLLSKVLLWSYVFLFHFFITLPARTPTFATILGKLSFQKCFTSLFGSINTLPWPTWNCGKQHSMRAPDIATPSTRIRGDAGWGPAPARDAPKSTRPAARSSGGQQHKSKGALRQGEKRQTKRRSKQNPLGLPQESGSFQKCFTSLFWSNTPSLSSKVRLRSDASFHFFIILPALEQGIVSVFATL